MGMLADGTIADPCEAFLQLANLLYCGLLNKEHKILPGLQAYFVSWKRGGRCTKVAHSRAK